MRKQDRFTIEGWNTTLIHALPTNGEREDERFFGDGQGHDTGQGPVI